jgi:hypothetical protein
MQIKGTAVKTTPEFVKAKFRDRYYEWIENLPDLSRDIVGQPVFSTSWYDLYNAVILPTEKTGDLFFQSHIEAALELGRYSSEVALSGIYKIFIKISSPQFVLSRATNVFATYYNPAEIQIISSKGNSAILEMKGFVRKEELIVYRIAGWLEKTIELTTKSKYPAEIEKKYNGDYLTALISTKW